MKTEVITRDNIAPGDTVMALNDLEGKIDLGASGRTLDARHYERGKYYTVKDLPYKAKSGLCIVIEADTGDMLGVSASDFLKVVRD